jgi:hypothetical protein
VRLAAIPKMACPASKALHADAALVLRRREADDDVTTGFALVCLVESCGAEWAAEGSDSAGLLVEWPAPRLRNARREFFVKDRVKTRMAVAEAASAEKRATIFRFIRNKIVEICPGLEQSSWAMQPQPLQFIEWKGFVISHDISLLRPVLRMVMHVALTPSRLTMQSCVIFLASTHGHL